jgi:hypothetical protein
MKKHNPLLEGGLYDNEHGGGCCGMTHLSEFPEIEDMLDEDYRIPTVKERSDFIRSSISSGGHKHCYEIVLTDSQLKYWRSAVRMAGFRRVNRFLNSNSGNYCNVFHLTTNQPQKAVS